MEIYNESRSPLLQQWLEKDWGWLASIVEEAAMKKLLLRSYDEEEDLESTATKYIHKLQEFAKKKPWISRANNDNRWNYTKRN